MKTAEADLRSGYWSNFRSLNSVPHKPTKALQKARCQVQVFVSTKGGENVKLGAFEVALFARDAIDVLLAGLKTNADIKMAAVSRIGSVQAEDRAVATSLELSISVFWAFRFRGWKLTPMENSSFRFLRVVGSLSLLRRSAV